eukprot:6190605-Pleurochrysis_carterae.AAC.1
MATPSSKTLTRIRVTAQVAEEVFGRWKNRFRFLLRATYNKHKLTSLLIYTSMILHNLCTVCRGNEVKGYEPTHLASATWDKYCKEFTSEVCPGCTRRGAKHCIHAAENRNGASTQEALRNADHGAYRAIMRDSLWRKFIANTEHKSLTPEEDLILCEHKKLHKEMMRRTIEGI